MQLYLLCLTRKVIKSSSGTTTNDLVITQKEYEPLLKELRRSRGEALLTVRPGVQVMANHIVAILAAEKKPVEEPKVEEDES